MRNCVEEATTSNASLHKKLHRQRIANQNALCTICPPHSGENAKRVYRYPVKKAFQLKRRGKEVKYGKTVKTF